MDKKSFLLKNYANYSVFELSFRTDSVYKGIRIIDAEACMQTLWHCITLHKLLFGSYISQSEKKPPEIISPKAWNMNTPWGKRPM